MVSSLLIEKKTFAYVKDEKSNPNVITIALKYVMRSCKLLGLDESFQGSYFGHILSKACQYAIANEKVCKKFKYVPIKYA